LFDRSGEADTLRLKEILRAVERIIEKVGPSTPTAPTANL